jgi:pimeloyl-ACP methyl ester carboxylesterase
MQLRCSNHAYLHWTCLVQLHPLCARFALVFAASAFACAQNAPAESPDHFTFAPKPGPYPVGFRVVFQYDYSRTLQDAVDSLGKPNTAELARPVQTLIWYPAHSIAGIYMRDYAAHYPEDLAGMVFVDGSTPMQQENPAIKAMMGKEPPPWVIALVGNAAFSVGIPRLMGMCSRTSPGLNARSSRLQAEDHCELHVNSSMNEARNIERSGLETQHSGPYGSLPILIFSHDPEKTMATENSTQKMAEGAWSQMQEDLKKLSTRSRRIIAKGSKHYIQTDRADLIEKEVPLFIQQIRGTAPQPTNYGSTVTE